MSTQIKKKNGKIPQGESKDSAIQDFFRCAPDELCSRINVTVNKCCKDSGVAIGEVAALLGLELTSTANQEGNISIAEKLDGGLLSMLTFLLSTDISRILGIDFGSANPDVKKKWLQKMEFEGGTAKAYTGVSGEFQPAPDSLLELHVCLSILDEITENKKNGNWKLTTKTSN